MKKPKQQIIKIYNYSTCKDYIEKKYKIDVDDYTGVFTNNAYSDRYEKVRISLNIDNSDLEEDLSKADMNDPEVKRKLENRRKLNIEVEKISPEYCSFWHWILDSHEVHNGSTIYLSSDMADDGTWQKEILDLFIKEFGDDKEYLVQW